MNAPKYASKHSRIVPDPNNIWRFTLSVISRKWLVNYNKLTEIIIRQA